MTVAAARTAELLHSGAEVVIPEEIDAARRLIGARLRGSDGEGGAGAGTAEGVA